jgi:flagellar basal-body rod protein FlgC
MGIANVFNIAGSGMSAQTVRLNTIASNIANAETVSGSESTAYKARFPVFMARAATGSLFSENAGFNQGVGENNNMGVVVSEIVESSAPVEKRYMPDHPLADEQGYVFISNVNTVEEMADMISASRSFQMNVEMANTAKSMAQRLLTLGQ